jgi:hypothetical protein
MTDEYGEILVVLGFVSVWGLVFFGIWTIPISDYSRIVVDEAVTIFIPAFGIMYFDYKGKIPIGAEMRQKIWFWFFVGLELLQALVAFSLTITTWEVVEIEGHQVITYEDLVSLLFSIGGILVIVYVIYMIRNRQSYMKRERGKKNE